MPPNSENRRCDGRLSQNEPERRDHRRRDGELGPKEPPAHTGIDQFLGDADNESVQIAVRPTTTHGSSRLTPTVMAVNVEATRH